MTIVLKPLFFYLRFRPFVFRQPLSEHWPFCRISHRREAPFFFRKFFLEGSLLCDGRPSYFHEQVSFSLLPFFLVGSWDFGLATLTRFLFLSPNCRFLRNWGRRPGPPPAFSSQYWCRRSPEVPPFLFLRRFVQIADDTRRRQPLPFVPRDLPLAPSYADSGERPLSSADRLFLPPFFSSLLYPAWFLQKVTHV